MKSFPRTFSNDLAGEVGKSSHRKSYTDKQSITNHVISMKPDGLGRRIMCLFSAFKASQYLNCRLSVVWPENDHCDCSFSDLFNCNADIQVYPGLLSCLEQNATNIGLLKNRRSMLFGTAGDLVKYLNKGRWAKLFAKILVRHLDKSIWARLFARIDGSLILTSGPVQDYSKVFSACETVVIKMAKQIQVDVSRCVLDCFLDNFSIAPTIQERIDAFVQKHRFHNTLGLHVREGDIAQERNHKRYIPMRAYHDKLEEIMDSRRIDRIFLSTQSNDTTLLFQQMYGDKVILYPSEDYTRGSVGVQNALIDIMLLSKCDLILGPQSEFNTAAALIGDKQLIQIEKQSVMNEE